MVDEAVTMKQRVAELEESQNEIKNSMEKVKIATAQTGIQANETLKKAFQSWEKMANIIEGYKK